MADEHLRLENQLCFSVYATAREITKLYRPLLEELNVTYPQYLVLLVLWEEDRLTVKELGHRLYLDSGTLTPMLKRMEQADYLQRIRSKEDERVVVVTLTEKGRAARKQANDIPHLLLDHIDVDPDELSQMKGTLMKVLQSVHVKNGDTKA
ncbi:MarR family transcriptional regulator [Pontibacillus halophilus JSM 076056 = DSM 19796]|uniref:HTH-type transcriptional regulator SarZ n=1 Tax=Pontibacillus halophilus JSM 076056 = DSM 19796 TaxID=1385510 RepID=A0A0A5G741_9BACI|nr:MarR family transcriptional regulator [Pontibacillus halophilus]KGX87879.1 MarR family transcriptional regulator [Pontibacillus halophilus JSM 076056 = DSM 19796]